MKRWLWFLVGLGLVYSVVLAKRIPPPLVPPITHAGVIYSAQHDGKTEIVVAEDEKSGSELWRAAIYSQRVDQTKEIDVQMIFIKGMILSGERLLLQDEAGRCYQVDLTTRKVEGVNCKKYRSLKPAKQR
jgi:hypothetical protein